MLNSNLSNRLRIVREVELLGFGRHAVINEFQVRPHLCGFPHPFDRHVNGRQHRMCDNDTGDTLLSSLPNEHQAFLAGIMSGGHDEMVFRDHRDNRLCLRKKLTVTGDGDISPSTLLCLGRRVGVEGSHPNKSSKAAGRECHLLNCSRVHAADAQIEVDTSERLYPRNDLLYQIGSRSSRFVMVLEYNGSHSSALRQLRQVNGIDAPRDGVWRGMCMDIDDACERPGLSMDSHARETAPKQDDQSQ